MFSWDLKIYIWLHLYFGGHLVSHLGFLKAINTKSFCKPHNWIHWLWKNTLTHQTHLSSWFRMQDMILFFSVTVFAVCIIYTCYSYEWIKSIQVKYNNVKNVAFNLCKFAIWKFDFIKWYSPWIASVKPLLDLINKIMWMLWTRTSQKNFKLIGTD